MRSNNNDISEASRIFNSLVNSASSRIPARQAISFDVLLKWQEGSFEAYQKAGFEYEKLKRVLYMTDWDLSEEKPPENVWFGEVNFIERKKAKVLVYKKSLATRLPNAAFNLVGQMSVDHVVGHLYPFYDENSHFGELAACKNQLMAAKTRGFFWEVASAAAVSAYLLHKGLSFENPAAYQGSGRV